MLIYSVSLNWSKFFQYDLLTDLLSCKQADWVALNLHANLLLTVYGLFFGGELIYEWTDHL